MSGENTQKYPDVAQVRAQARAAWVKQQRGMLSIQERIGESIPWWIVVFAAVFFLLSVPHTMAVFNQITPRWGKVAPFGIEFGLLYGSFRRKQVQKLSFQLLLFEMFLFVIAVIVNGAGSFQAVVQSSENIGGLSMGQLWHEYPGLPATSQVALLLAPLAALVIPIGTAVAGEGLATLVLERQRTGNLLEARWAQVRTRIEFEALRDAALSCDVTPGKAVRWAENITRYDGELASVAGSGNSRQVSAADSRTSGQQRTAADDFTPTDRQNGHDTGQGYSKQMDARELARMYIEHNPDALSMSVRELASVVGIGKTTAAEVRAQYVNGNGHHKAS